jgi:hypothetical protein
MTEEPIFWAWVRVVRRAELGFNPDPKGNPKKRVGSDTVQHVALVAVTYGNPDGTRIRPSVARLARVCRKDERTVRACLGRLRDLGLLIRVFEGSSAGRSAMADEYRMAIPDDLLERVAMLDPDERELIVPDGVEPPRAKRPRPDRSGTPEGGTPGAAPCDQPGDPDVHDAGTPGAAPADPGLPDGNHRVLPPGTPGAAPTNTGCSTRPPTHRPTNHLPTHISSPYGAEVEGRKAGRREPPARDQIRFRQPPLLGLVAGPPPDTADYEAARTVLAALPDLGAALMAAARAGLPPGTPRAQLVIHAAELAQRPA